MAHWSTCTRVQQWRWKWKKNNTHRCIIFPPFNSINDVIRMTTVRRIIVELSLFFLFIRWSFAFERQYLKCDNNYIPRNVWNIRSMYSVGTVHSSILESRIEFQITWYGVFFSCSGFTEWSVWYVNICNIFLQLLI